MAEYSRKLSRKMSKRLVHIGVANATRMHLYQHLTWSHLRLRNIFDLPRTAHGGYDCSFHMFPPRAIRCMIWVLELPIACLNERFCVQVANCRAFVHQITETVTLERSAYFLMSEARRCP